MSKNLDQIRQSLAKHDITFHWRKQLDELIDQLASSLGAPVA